MQDSRTAADALAAIRAADDALAAERSAAIRAAAAHAPATFQEVVLWLDAMPLRQRVQLLRVLAENTVGFAEKRRADLYEATRHASHAEVATQVDMSLVALRKALRSHNAKTRQSDTQEGHLAMQQQPSPATTGPVVDWPVGRHLLIAGATPAETSRKLMDAARKHLAVGGTLWTFTSSEDTTASWLEQVKIRDWLVTGQDVTELSDQVFSAVSLIDSRAKPGVPPQAYCPVMLVLDQLLPEHLAAPTTLSADLASVLRLGKFANVSLAAATPSLEQLPEHLRQAAKANATITHGGRGPQPA
jgi:hypothetical protein